MKLKILGLTLLAAVSALLGAAAPASAQRERWNWDNYREYRFYRGRDAREQRRREVLRDRSFDLYESLRLARREHYISGRTESRNFDRLDRVRDFLRHDRYLDTDEFRRRMDDLDRVEDDLRDVYRGHREYRFGRYYHYDWRGWEGRIDRDRDRLDRDRDRLDRDRDRRDRDDR